ncbi:MAG: ATP-binding protein [Cryomorphaceae bacterium]|nr:ATP-binding protein [Cryomorphaceae bacterium]
MEELLEISESLIAKVPVRFKRYLFDRINWQNRLIGIKGARGTGKTTMLLQWLKTLKISNHQKAYFSLDELYFTTHSLSDTAKTFYQQGGKVLVLDEVHKYPTWSKEIKNLYDRYEDLQIVFTGSSIIDIARQEGDLCRRALLYELKGMSYREYLNFSHKLDFPAISLETLVTNDGSLRELFPADFKPLAYFKEYLQFGYYPFFASDKQGFHTRLRQLVRTIVEYDMAEMEGFDIRHAKKMLQLLYVVAQQVPFKPNIKNLASKTGIHRNSMNNYLYFLGEARLLSLLNKSGISVSTLQKPDKIFLENTNLLFALSDLKPEIGTVREVFFNNQLQEAHQVSYSETTDFEIDGRFSFEVGGKNKSRKQLQGLQDGILVKDEIEYPVGKTIPLWLFGFLY